MTGDDKNSHGDVEMVHLIGYRAPAKLEERPAILGRLACMDVATCCAPRKIPVRGMHLISA